MNTMPSIAGDQMLSSASDTEAKLRARVLADERPNDSHKKQRSLGPTAFPAAAQPNMTSPTGTYDTGTFDVMTRDVSENTIRLMLTQPAQVVATNVQPYNPIYIERERWMYQARIHAAMEDRSAFVSTLRAGTHMPTAIGEMSSLSDEIRRPAGTHDELLRIMNTQVSPHVVAYMAQLAAKKRNHRVNMALAHQQQQQQIHYRQRQLQQLQQHVVSEMAQFGREAIMSVPISRDRAGCAALDQPVVSLAHQRKLNASMGGQVSGTAMSRTFDAQTGIASGGTGRTASSAAIMVAPSPPPPPRRMKQRATIAGLAGKLRTTAMLFKVDALSSLPALLAHPGDTGTLSLHQAYLRRQVEIFQATEVDISHSTRGRNKQLTLGQVGIRCRHCVHLPVSQHQKGSRYFPATLLGLYQAAQNMSSNHIQCGLCTQMPKSIKDEFVRLIPSKNFNSFSGRLYWADKAKQMGLVDTEDGIMFDPFQSIGSHHLA